MSERPRAIVLGHADFATGLVSAGERITGLGALFTPMSNDGLGCSDIEQRLREVMEAEGVRVIFTDLPAGSCNLAAIRLAAGSAEVVVVTGVNQPALLAFATQPLDPERAERGLAEHAVEKGAPALKVIAGRPRVR